MKFDPDVDKTIREILDRTIPEITGYFADRMRATFMAGLEMGNERNQNVIAEVTKILASAAKPTVPANGEQPQRQAVTPSRFGGGRANGAYRGVVEAVRLSLNEVGRCAGGADAGSMLAVIHTKLARRDITLQQVRSSLKQLLDTGEATRCQRGQYKAGPSLTVPKTNGTTTLFAGAA